MIKRHPLKSLLLVIAPCPSCWFICRLERTRGDRRQFHLDLRSTEFPAIG